MLWVSLTSPHASVQATGQSLCAVKRRAGLVTVPKIFRKTRHTRAAISFQFSLCSKPYIHSNHKQ